MGRKDTKEFLIYVNKHYRQDKKIIISVTQPENKIKLFWKFGKEIFTKPDVEHSSCYLLQGNWQD